MKAHFAKNECQSLLNKLCTVQAFYNSIDLGNLAGISRDPKTQAPLIANLNDRKLVQKQF